MKECHRPLNFIERTFVVSKDGNLFARLFILVALGVVLIFELAAKFNKGLLLKALVLSSVRAKKKKEQSGKNIKIPLSSK